MAAAAAQDMASLTDFAFDLDDEEAGGDVALMMGTVLEPPTQLFMDVFEVVVKADATVDAVVDETGDVQWTGGFGKAVGAGAS